MEAYSAAFSREQCEFDGKGWCLALGDTETNDYTVLGFYRSSHDVLEMLAHWQVTFTMLYPKGADCEHVDVDVREDTCVCYECGRTFLIDDDSYCDCDECLAYEKEKDEDETI